MECPCEQALIALLPVPCDYEYCACLRDETRKDAWMAYYPYEPAFDLEPNRATIHWYFSSHLGIHLIFIALAS